MGSNYAGTAACGQRPRCFWMGPSSREAGISLWDGRGRARPKRSSWGVLEDRREFMIELSDLDEVSYKLEIVCFFQERDRIGGCSVSLDSTHFLRVVFKFDNTGVWWLPDRSSSDYMTPTFGTSHTKSLFKIFKNSTFGIKVFNYEKVKFQKSKLLGLVFCSFYVGCGCGCLGAKGQLCPSPSHQAWVLSARAHRPAEEGLDSLQSRRHLVARPFFCHIKI